MTRTLKDIIQPGQSIRDLTEAQQNEISDLFEAVTGAYEPTPEDHARARLRAIAHRRALIEADAAEAVKCARAAHLSWTGIGEQLGTTGEAARQRYKDLVA